VACGSFSQLYQLGAEVSQSCHPGMEVRLATKKATGEQVVVKRRCKTTSFADESDERDWKHCTELLLNLPPSAVIARINEALEDREAFYVVMEKVGGKDLCEVILSGEKLPIAEVREVLRQLLLGLTELHSRGLLHRDLKLENVMVDRSPPACPSARSRSSISSASTCTSSKSSNYGDVASRRGCGRGCRTPLSVKLIDFDTVEEYSPQSRKCSQDVQGTNQYLAPETYEGHYSCSSDVFAVGAIAYILLTGRFPFSDDVFDDDKANKNYVGCETMLRIKERLSAFKINWDHAAFKHDPQCLDLVKSMLAKEKQDRPSARRSLRHPWMAGGDAPPIAQLPKGCVCNSFTKCDSVEVIPTQ